MFTRKMIALLFIPGLMAAEQPALKALPKDAVAIPLQPISFAQDVVGKPAAHFTYGVIGAGPDVRWEIEYDPLAAGRRKILTQKGKAESGQNIAMALVNDRVLQNGEVVIRFRINNGEDDQAAGIVWRYRDQANFYVARASAKDDNCTVYRMKAGKFKEISSHPIVVTPYTWHELRVSFNQRDFSAILDGEIAVGGKDKGLLDGGQFGLATFSDSVVRFDDLRVTP